MGLALSVLVFSVGVLEAMSCLEHVRQSYLPLEFRRRRRRLVLDVASGTVRHREMRRSTEFRRDSLSLLRRLSKQFTYEDEKVCDELSAIWDRVEAGRVHSTEERDPNLLTVSDGRGGEESSGPSRSSTPDTVILIQRTEDDNATDETDIPFEEGFCMKCVDEKFDLLAGAQHEEHKIEIGIDGACCIHDSIATDYDGSIQSGGYSAEPYNVIPTMENMKSEQFESESFISDLHKKEKDHNVRTEPNSNLIHEGLNIYKNWDFKEENKLATVGPNGPHSSYDDSVPSIGEDINCSVSDKKTLTPGSEQQVELERAVLANHQIGQPFIESNDEIKIDQCGLETTITSKNGDVLKKTTQTDNSEQDFGGSGIISGLTKQFIASEENNTKSYFIDINEERLEAYSNEVVKSKEGENETVSTHPKSLIEEVIEVVSNFFGLPADKTRNITSDDGINNKQPFNCSINKDVCDDNMLQYNSPVVLEDKGSSWQRINSHTDYKNKEPITSTVQESLALSQAVLSNNDEVKIKTEAQERDCNSTNILYFNKKPLNENDIKSFQKEENSDISIKKELNTLFIAEEIGLNLPNRKSEPTKMSEIESDNHNSEVKDDATLSGMNEQNKILPTKLKEHTDNRPLAEITKNKHPKLVHGNTEIKSSEDDQYSHDTKPCEYDDKKPIPDKNSSSEADGQLSEQNFLLRDSSTGDQNSLSEEEILRTAIFSEAMQDTTEIEKFQKEPVMLESDLRVNESEEDDKTLNSQRQVSREPVMTVAILQKPVDEPVEENIECLKRKEYDFRDEICQNAVEQVKNKSQSSGEGIINSNIEVLDQISLKTNEIEVQDKKLEVISMEDVETEHTSMSKEDEKPGPSKNSHILVGNTKVFSAHGEDSFEGLDISSISRQGTYKESGDTEIERQEEFVNVKNIKQLGENLGKTLEEPLFIKENVEMVKIEEVETSAVYSTEMVDIEKSNERTANSEICGSSVDIYNSMEDTGMDKLREIEIYVVEKNLEEKDDRDETEAKDSLINTSMTQNDAVYVDNTYPKDGSLPQETLMHVEKEKSVGVKSELSEVETKCIATQEEPVISRAITLGESQKENCSHVEENKEFYQLQNYGSPLRMCETTPNSVKNKNLSYDGEISKPPHMDVDLSEKITLDAEKTKFETTVEHSNISREDDKESLEKTSNDVTLLGEKFETFTEDDKSLLACGSACSDTSSSSSQEVIVAEPLSKGNGGSKKLLGIEEDHQLEGNLGLGELSYIEEKVEETKNEANEGLKNYEEINPAPHLKGMENCDEKELSIAEKQLEEKSGCAKIEGEHIDSFSKSKGAEQKDNMITKNDNVLAPKENLMPEENEKSVSIKENTLEVALKQLKSDEKTKNKAQEESPLKNGCTDQEVHQLMEMEKGDVDDDITVVEGSKPPQKTDLEDITSPNKAFWLIFSGEYTKAMNKDWHSGHFCCWQCDESLTGQRYVLRDDHPYCIKCYEQVFANSCDECSKVIGIDSKDLSYKDKHWHEACFLCSKCRVSLVDKQFGSKADKIYCGNCYDAQFASRCDGCGQIFRAGTKKMEYKTRQWHEQCFCCCVCKTPIGTKSFIPREQEIYCAGCYEEKFATRCVKCNKIITSGGVTYKNEPWHRECFTCTNCSTSLAGQRFTSRDEKPYCADCFGELFAKRCTSCCKPITGIGGTRFISFEDRHWHNDCFICASCKSSLVGRGFITDAEDILCTECAKQKLM